MNRNNINFDNKNIKKSEFHNKDIKIFTIDDIDVNNLLVSKKEQYGNIIRLNTLLGIMIMILSDHYIYLFQKLLATLINLKKIK